MPARPPIEKAWRGEDLTAEPERWTRHLTKPEVAALEKLGHTPQDLLIADHPNSITTSDPDLRALANEVRAALLDGLGMILLRGFDAASLGPQRSAVSYYLFSQLIGSTRSQNAQGHLLGHVRDVGADPTDPTSRIYQTNQRQTFHTDSTDAVGLLCLQTAKSGGDSLVASVTAIYAACVERNPELARLLFLPVATDRRGEQPPGERPWFEIPVLSWFDGKLTALYQRQYIESARRFPEAPSPNETHTKALDLFDEVANDPAIHLSMRLEPGDIQFVHNHSLLHDRTGFVDYLEPERRRHLLRVWLSLRGDRALPPSFTQRYGSVEVGERGGIVVEGTELCVPLG